MRSGRGSGSTCHYRQATTPGREWPDGIGSDAGWPGKNQVGEPSEDLKAGSRNVPLWFSRHRRCAMPPAPPRSAEPSSASTRQKGLLAPVQDRLGPSETNHSTRPAGMAGSPRRSPSAVIAASRCHRPIRAEATAPAVRLSRPCNQPEPRPGCMVTSKLRLHRSATRSQGGLKHRLAERVYSPFLSVSAILKESVPDWSNGEEY